MLKKRKTIALLSDSFCGEYQTAIRNAIEMATRQYDYDFCCVIGRDLDSPRPHQRVQNRIFQHVGVDSISGIIVMSSSLSNHCSVERLTSFCHQFSSLPLCSFGTQLKDVPSIVVNNDCYSEIVSHLVDTHQCKRFAYIGGPETNQEAQQRRASFIKALAANGLTFDTDLEYEGNFMVQSGIKGCTELLDKQNAFDALIAANDEMALGALSVLKSRRIYVPEDVKVVGFDDLSESKFSTPKLSTIRQPLELMSIQAVEKVIELIHGARVTPLTVIPPQFIARQSCGCNEHVSYKLSTAQFRIDEDTNAESEQKKGWEEAFLAIVKIPRTAYSGWSRRLANALFDEIRKGRRGRFIYALDEVLLESNYNSWLCDGLQKAVTVFRDAFRDQSSVTKDALDDLWHQARLTIFNAVTYHQVWARMAQVRTNTVLIERTIDQQSDKMDKVTVAEAMKFEFETIGIKNAAIAMFTDSECNELECVIAIRDGVSIRDSRCSFSAKQLIPDFLDIDAPTSFVVFPLSRQEKYLGVMILENVAADIYYEILREYMSDTLSKMISQTSTPIIPRTGQG